MGLGGLGFSIKGGVSNNELNQESFIVRLGVSAQQNNCKPEDDCHHKPVCSTSQLHKNFPVRHN